MIITGQGYLPVDVIGEQVWFDSAVKRIPLVRRGEPVTKTYCVFWKKDNSGYYIEEFAEMLKRSLRESVFLCCLHTKQTYLKNCIALQQCDASFYSTCSFNTG